MASAPYRDEESGGTNILTALPIILWQRRWLIIVPALLAGAGGITAAYTIPKVFESSATVLIESPQIVNDDPATISDLVDERITRARERVLSRQALIQVIRANNLYPREQQSGTPFSTIVEKMRDNTVISGVASEVSGLRGLNGNKQTITLKIAFDYPDPAKAQVVTQQFVNQFLEVDASAQQNKATGAAASLEQQAADLRDQIQAIEDKVTKIKSDNGAVLAMASQSTGNPLADASRIDADIASLGSENTKLQAQLGASGGDSQVAAAEANYRALSARLSPTHPDVIAAKANLDAMKAASAGGSGTSSAEALLRAQVAANRSQIASLQNAKSMMMSQSATARDAMTRGPAIAAEVDQLEKQAEVLRDQYRSVNGRSANAQLSAKMETEQKGERLTLVDPPVVADVPIKPKKPILIAGGFAAGIGFGLALALALELLMRPVRGADAIKSITGSAPLAIIPDYGRKPHFLIRWLEKRNRARAGVGG